LIEGIILARKAVLKNKKSTGARKTAPVVFFTTFSKREDAEKFARHVVGQKLAACVNLVAGITSFYIWQGKEHAESEILAIGKTTQSAFKKLKSQMKTLHPYEVPELISFSIDDGLPEYLTWIKENSL
jgi:periplasmic divalent cation tolerance protein